MLEAGSEATHPRPGGMATCFVYVHEGVAVCADQLYMPAYAARQGQRNFYE